MLSRALKWLHLAFVIAIIAGANVLQGAVSLFYWLFPFKFILDFAWRRSTWLRAVFALRLGREDAATAKTALFYMSSRELIETAGFACEEHAVTTADGYVLGVQRVIVRDEGGEAVPAGPLTPQPARPSATVAAAGGASTPRSQCFAAPARVASARIGRPNAGRPPVLVMHGLMQCSEAWVVGGRQEALPFLLADAGYDVWLGNNRGNKYGQKHLTKHPDSNEFWDYSLDELARYDLPAMITHIQRVTGCSKVAYVGFSQGSAQAFAALALHPRLNDQLSCFIALSPALAVRGLARSPLVALVESDLSFFYTIFGCRPMLPSALDVQRILSGSAWASFLDACLMYLFAWRSTGMDAITKLQAYHHIYSFASVKSVVHWFQILSTGRFAMFVDVPRRGLLASAVAGLPIVGSAGEQQHRVSPLYDTSKISVPIALFAGEADTLISIDRLVGMLPPLSAPVPMPSASTAGGRGDAACPVHGVSQQRGSATSGLMGTGMPLAEAFEDVASLLKGPTASGKDGSAMDTGTMSGPPSLFGVRRRGRGASTDAEGMPALAAASSAGEGAGGHRFTGSDQRLGYGPRYALGTGTGALVPHASTGKMQRQIAREAAAAVVASTSPQARATRAGRLTASPPADSGSAGAFNTPPRRAQPTTTAGSGGGSGGRPPAASGSGSTSATASVTGGTTRSRANTANSALQLLAAAFHDAVGGYGDTEGDLPHARRPHEQAAVEPTHHMMPAGDYIAGPSVTAGGGGRSRSGTETAAVLADGTRTLARVLPDVGGDNHDGLLVARETDAAVAASSGCTCHQASSWQWVHERQPLVLHVEPEWEHLDSMWGANARDRAYPLIVRLLRRYQHMQVPVGGSSSGGRHRATSSSTSPPPPLPPPPHGGGGSGGNSGDGNWHRRPLGGDSSSTGDDDRARLDSSHGHGGGHRGGTGTGTGTGAGTGAGAGGGRHTTGGRGRVAAGKQPTAATDDREQHQPAPIDSLTLGPADPSEEEGDAPAPPLAPPLPDSTRSSGVTTPVTAVATHAQSPVPPAVAVVA